MQTGAWTRDAIRQVEAVVNLDAQRRATEMFISPDPLYAAHIKSDMTLSPRLLKGGLVQVDPDTAKVLRVIALQYNPDTLTRTLQVQATGESGGDRSEALRLKGAAVETIKLEAEIDATDQLDDPDANPTPSSSASTRSSRRSRRSSTRAPTTCRRTTRSPASGVLEVLPLEAPLTLFVWSKQRVVPVRVTDLSVTEEAFDVALNPIRAKVSLGLRVLSVDDLGFEPPRRHAVHGLPAQQGERSPAAPRRCRCRSSAWRALADARSAARAARRRRRPDDDVPADEPLRRRRRRRVGSRRRRAAGAVPAPPLLPARRALRAAVRGAASSRATAATCSRARHLGDAELCWRLADANGVVDPRDLTDAGRPAPADHAARGSAGAERWLSPVRLQLLIGPGRAGAGAARGARRGAGGEGRVGLGRDAERLRAHASGISNRSPLQTLFLLTGGASIPILRVVIVVTLSGTTTVLMDGVMTHHELRSDGGPTSTLVVKGKDLTALMDVIPLDGLPYPAMPPALRVLVALAKYAAFGVVPLVIPSVLEDIPIPIERIPRHQGTDYAYIKALADEVGYVFYLDPGPVPGMSMAYWGPGDPRRRAAAGARTSTLDGAQQRREPRLHASTRRRKELPVVFIQEPTSKAPIPIPIPDITPLNPPLGARAAAAAEDHVPQRHRRS